MASSRGFSVSLQCQTTLMGHSPWGELYNSGDLKGTEPLVSKGLSWLNQDRCPWQIILTQSVHKI